MISDVLAEAVDGINSYLTNDAFEGIYEGALRARIERLRDTMEAVRGELDDLAVTVVQTGEAFRLVRAPESES